MPDSTNNSSAEMRSSELALNLRDVGLNRTKRAVCPASQVNKVGVFKLWFWRTWDDAERSKMIDEEGLVTYEISPELDLTVAIAQIRPEMVVSGFELTTLNEITD